MTGDWRARIACGPDTASLFDPLEDRDRKGTAGAERIRDAKAICAGCPVRVECLTSGIEDGEHGVRGGEYLEAGQVQASLPEFGRPKAVCGTDSARTRHRRNRERCSVCWPPNEAKRTGRPPRENLKPHGTHAAYMRHYSQGEPACEPCVEGHRKYERDRKARTRGSTRRAPLREHGTHAAFQRHRRAAEQPCQPCIDAERANDRARYARTLLEAAS